MDQKLGTIALSDDIFDKAKIGLWAFELDEGSAPRMYVNDVMLGLIGLKEQVSPEETYHAWYDHIDHGSYGLVAESVEKMTAGERAEVQYPWHHPDGHTMVVRCGGVRNYAYTAGVRIEGTHQNVSDVIHFEETEHARIEQQMMDMAHISLRADALSYIAEHDADIEEFMDFFGARILEVAGCDQVIYRDLNGDRVVCSADGIEDIPQDICSKCAFSDFESSVYDDGGIVMMNDCSAGFRGIMTENNCPAKSSFMQRIYSDGRLVGLLTLHYLRNRHDFTDTEISMMKTVATYLGLLLSKLESRRIKERETKREKQQLSLNLLAALADSYEVLYTVTPESGEYEIYRRNDAAYHAAVTGDFGHDIYTDCLRGYEQFVYPEDQQRFKEFFKKENVLCEMAAKGTRTLDFRIVRDGDIKWFRDKMVSLHNEDGEERYAIGVMDLTEEKRKEQAAKMDQEIIEILASEYSSVYYIDLTTDELNPYTMNAETESEFGQIFNSGITYSDAFKLYVSRLIYSEDKAMMLKAGSVTNIREELKNKKTFLTTYRNSDNLYCEMKFVKVGAENDEPAAVALGFAEKDAQLRQEQAIEHERQQNFDIIEILASEYTSVYYIDLTTDGLNPYTMNEETETTFGSVFRSGITYSEAYRLYVDRLVFPEDKAMMLKAGSIGNIMKELRTKKTFITTYRDAEEHYSEMKFVKVGNNEGIPDAVALGFADKDAELRAKEEEERVLKRNIDIIEILASEYSSVYYIDLTTDELDPYTMNEETESEFGQIFRSGIKYSEAFRLYVDTLVDDADKALMLKSGSTYNILKELAVKKTFLTTYRNALGHYCEMKFVKVGDSDNPEAVALGFADKDDEIRGEMERKRIMERDMAVITGLSDDFGCVVYVDLDTNEETHYRFDKLFEQNIPGWANINNYSTRLSSLIDNVMHPDDKEEFYAKTRKEVIVDNIKDGAAYYVNFRTLIKGEITYYQAKFVKDPHSDNHMVAGFHNVDSETKREMEALDKAETASRAKTDFLFNMSHDIRTPMNAIIGFTNMAVRDIDDRAKALDSLTKTQRASEMLLSIINDILDMSRIESGKVTISESSCDFNNSFEDISSVMGELAAARNIDLTFDISGVKHSRVFVDIPRVERILVNIISNAIKYTNEGGYVKVRAEEVADSLPAGAPLSDLLTGMHGNDSASAGQNRHLYRYTVEDNGIGMSEEFVTRCFDEFAREENSTTSGIQGTGLGLSLAKALTELMGGRISCVSRQGVGSTFTIELPFRQVPEEAAGTMSADGASDTEISFRDVNVLLVEDNELNREIAVDMLTEEGMHVFEAVDGRDAIEKVRRQAPDFYRFILMDIQMPFMNGYDAARAIRELYPDAHIPIIALSANAFEEDKQKSRDAGMDDHVAKPIKLQQLKKVLAKFM